LCPIAEEPLTSSSVKFSVYTHKKTKNITTTKTTTMKSTSNGTSPFQAQNTGTRPLTLIDAILYSAVSNDADSSPALSLPLPTTSDSPETAAVKRTRLLMILDLAMALIDEGEADITSVIDESNSTLKRRPLQ
jgi:hypothetical protein